jgi:hypothetical protein
LRRFAGEEGVLFAGKAQEKTPVFRTERRRSPRTGLPYPWIERSSAMVNQYYVYTVDRDFGPFFLKFCSTSRSTPSCASTATGTPSASWPRRGSSSRRSTTPS